MLHEFTHDGQRYAVHVPDEGWCETPGQRAIDGTHKDHRKDKDWFRTQQLGRLNGILIAAVIKGTTPLWNGHPLVIEKVENVANAETAKPNA